MKRSDDLFHSEVSETPDEAFQLDSYDFELPQERIAQNPHKIRDNSRLLIVNKTKSTISHSRFYSLPEVLKEGDLLVLNDTKVVKALIPCVKPTGAQIDLLALDPIKAEPTATQDVTRRVCLAKTSKGLRSGASLFTLDQREIRIVRLVGGGRIEVEFPVHEKDFPKFLDEYGKTPLPPYIKPMAENVDRDAKSYQTVYASGPGSVAAPTAGLHFTEKLLADLTNNGVETTRITLHVGPGTFQPVRTQDIRRNRMESEEYQITSAAAGSINQAISDGRRIIAVGTTCVRTLESAITPSGRLNAGSGKTDLFIYPGYKFRLIKNMLTNFHLPKSTLFMLVCALGGTHLMRRAYQTAIQEGYSFYSYGDAGIIFE